LLLYYYTSRPDTMMPRGCQHPRLAFLAVQSYDPRSFDLGGPMHPVRPLRICLLIPILAVGLWGTTGYVHIEG